MQDTAMPSNQPLPPPDPQALAELRAQLLANPAQSEAAAHKAVQLARARYGWEAIVGEFVDFYAEVLA